MASRPPPVPTQTGIGAVPAGTGGGGGGGSAAGTSTPTDSYNFLDMLLASPFQMPDSPSTFVAAGDDGIMASLSLDAPADTGRPVATQPDVGTTPDIALPPQASPLYTATLGAMGGTAALQAVRQAQTVIPVTAAVPAPAPVAPVVTPSAAAAAAAGPTPELPLATNPLAIGADRVDEMFVNLFSTMDPLRFDTGVTAPGSSALDGSGGASGLYSTPSAAWSGLGSKDIQVGQLPPTPRSSPSRGSNGSPYCPVPAGTATGTTIAAVTAAAATAALPVMGPPPRVASRGEGRSSRVRQRPRGSGPAGGRGSGAAAAAAAGGSGGTIAVVQPAAADASLGADPPACVRCQHAQSRPSNSLRRVTLQLAQRVQSNLPKLLSITSSAELRAQLLGAGHPVETVTKWLKAIHQKPGRYVDRLPHVVPGVMIHKKCQDCLSLLLRTCPGSVAAPASKRRRASSTYGMSASVEGTTFDHTYEDPSTRPGTVPRS